MFLNIVLEKMNQKNGLIKVYKNGEKMIIVYGLEI